ESAVYSHPDIAPALHEGRLDFALGFLPTVMGVRQVPLMRDHYVVLAARSPGNQRRWRGKRRLDQAALGQLEFVVSRTHSEPLRVLEQLGVKDRIRQTTSHTLAMLE